MAATLSTSLETLAYIVVKAREYDAQVEPEGLEEGSNPADDIEIGILEDTPDNPTRIELRAALEALNDDQITEVLALTWLGRGDYGAREWNQALAAAREARDEHVIDYLLETPNLGDLIEQGLAELGYSILGEEMRL
ncbi:hypothetical protein GCM10010964_36000 [Caldovatus sediminis]|uniref:DUF3775 domain-containing protein n=1 Tax=Caldovatus sediminis TaxID=2041189 RepID=A0A8J2ZE04_9PROT|nr:DUF3775 domain-containing protein [Caldovatus sediminis]GGG45407.1 hypothetical protein GCM10010964_36000 [Caldovatus sediminis]